MGLFSNGFYFVIVIGLVKSSRTPSIYVFLFKIILGYIVFVVKLLGERFHTD